MKKLLIVALTLTFGVLLPRAQAVDSIPFLGSLRSEVVEQLTIASNNVAATNNVVANKKLIKTLQSALKSIDKTKTNYAAGAKTLSVLNKSLGRTITSNEFNPLIEGTVDVYVIALSDIYNALEDRVDASYPGKASDAARKALAKFHAAVENADTNSNFLLVLKSLAAATKAEVGAQKSVVKAEAAPAPPANITANVSGSTTVGINTLGAGIIAGAPGNFILSGAQAIRNPPGQRSVGFQLSGVTEGTSTATVTLGTITIQAGFSTTIYTSGTGTAQVTFNSAQHSLFGTYTFTANGSGGTVGTVTVTGTFTGSY